MITATVEPLVFELRFPIDYILRSRLDPEIFAIKSRSCMKSSDILQFLGLRISRGDAHIFLIQLCKYRSPSSIWQSLLTIGQEIRGWKTEKKVWSRSAGRQADWATIITKKFSVEIYEHRPTAKSVQYRTCIVWMADRPHTRDHHSKPAPGPNLWQHLHHKTWSYYQQRQCIIPWRIASRYNHSVCPSIRRTNLVM